MGCVQAKITSGKKISKNKVAPISHDLSLAPRPRPNLTGEEILAQLRQEGIIPEFLTPGGVAFSVPVEDGITPKDKPVRRLETVKEKRRYSSQERQIRADVYRHDKHVEQVRKKALERDIKKFEVKKEKERREFLKKMYAQQKLLEREERLRGLEEEKEGRKKGKKSAKRVERSRGMNVE